MVFGKSFDAIDSTDLQALIEAGASEAYNLEFKRELYGPTDAEKKEFLKDISAFANNLGGYLLIGADEQDGAISGLVPISEASVDRELQRLENIVRSGIEPTIVGLRIKRVDVPGGCILMIFVPRSDNPPHRVIYKNSNRFFARNSSGVHELGLEELRMLFGEQRSIEERARAFLHKRFQMLESGRGSMVVPAANGVVSLHLVPLPDFGANRRIPIKELERQDTKLCPIGASAFSGRFNLDGYCVYRGGSVCHGYTQIFRDGCIEAVSASMMHMNNGVRVLRAEALPERLLRSLPSYLAALKEIGASPPILVQISMFRTEGLNLPVDSWRVVENPPPFDRGKLHLPASVLSDYGDVSDYQRLIAEQMHFLWNAFDFDRCYYFDEDDSWIGRS